MLPDSSRTCSNKNMCLAGRAVGGLALALFLSGCLLEQAKKAANQIGSSRYEDMVAQFGSPAKTDRTFTGKQRAVWESSWSDSKGKTCTDVLTLIFDKGGLLEEVKYKDGTDDHEFINLFSGSFSCDERGKYPGGPTWPREDEKESHTPGTIREAGTHLKSGSEGWRSRK